MHSPVLAAGWPGEAGSRPSRRATAGPGGGAGRTYTCSTTRWPTRSCSGSPFSSAALPLSTRAPRSGMESPRVFAEAPLFKAVLSHGRRRSTQAWLQPRGPFPEEGWPQPLPRERQASLTQHDSPGQKVTGCREGGRVGGSREPWGCRRGRAGGEGGGEGLPEPLTAHERPARLCHEALRHHSQRGASVAAHFCTSVLPSARAT